MSRAIGYREALAWMVANDDTSWVAEPDAPGSVSAALLADIYGKSDDEVRADLSRLLERRERP